MIKEIDLVPTIILSVLFLSFFVLFFFTLILFDFVRYERSTRSDEYTSRTACKGSAYDGTCPISKDSPFPLAVELVLTNLQNQLSTLLFGPRRSSHRLLTDDQLLGKNYPKVGCGALQTSPE